MRRMCRSCSSLSAGLPAVAKETEEAIWSVSDISGRRWDSEAFRPATASFSNVSLMSVNVVSSHETDVSFFSSSLSAGSPAVYEKENGGGYSSVSDISGADGTAKLSDLSPDQSYTFYVGASPDTAGSFPVATVSTAVSQYAISIDQSGLADFNCQCGKGVYYAVAGSAHVAHPTVVADSEYDAFMAAGVQATFVYTGDPPVPGEEAIARPLDDTDDGGTLIDLTPPPLFGLTTAGGYFVPPEDGARIH